MRLTPQPVRALLVVLLLTAGVSVACGGSGGGGKIDLQHIPTATLPSTLQAAVIVSGTPLPSGSQRYVVKSGENPSSIAAQFGISVDELMAANGVTDPTSLHTGDVLTIPGQGQALASTSTPQPTARPTAGPTATPRSATGGETYIVQDGDIPETIAARFGISADELMSANGITDPRSLQVGQELVIPTPRPTATSAP